MLLLLWSAPCRRQRWLLFNFFLRESHISSRCHARALSAFNSQIAFRWRGWQQKSPPSPTLPARRSRYRLFFISFAAAHFRPAESNIMILASARRVTELPNARVISYKRVLGRAIFATPSSTDGRRSDVLEDSGWKGMPTLFFFFVKIKYYRYLYQINVNILI